MSGFGQRFEGRSALVTGGGSGIGRECSLRLAHEGAWVAILDQDIDRAKESLSAIEAAGGTGIALACDVSSSASIDAAVSLVAEQRQSLHVAVNCAGVGGSRQPFAGITDKGWLRTIGVNLSGVFYSMRAEHPLLKSSGGGAIVNISSILGTVGYPNEAAYVAAKHGVIGLTRSAALSWGRDKIRVTAVCPTFVRTGLTSDTSEEEWAHLQSLHPLDAIPTSEEVAGMVAYLGSDEARMVTGSVHLIDAGYTTG